jgi:hypothetical protein
MYQPIILPHFGRQLKWYLKKFRGLKNDVIDALENFDIRRHPHLGNNVYKVRLAGNDLARGKSKSFRLIILLVAADNFIVPITLYQKSEKDDITKKEINNHLEEILFELQHTAPSSSG